MKYLAHQFLVFQVFMMTQDTQKMPHIKLTCNMWTRTGIIIAFWVQVMCSMCAGVLALPTLNRTILSFVLSHLCFSCYGKSKHAVKVNTEENKCLITCTSQFKVKVIQVFTLFSPMFSLKAACFYIITQSM